MRQPFRVFRPRMLQYVLRTILGILAVTFNRRGWGESPWTITDTRPGMNRRGRKVISEMLTLAVCLHERTPLFIGDLWQKNRVPIKGECQSRGHSWKYLPTLQRKNAPVESTGQWDIRESKESHRVQLVRWHVLTWVTDFCYLRKEYSTGAAHRTTLSSTRR